MPAKSGEEPRGDDSKSGCHGEMHLLRTADQNTKIKAKRENREIGPNEITTACQDACASETVVFGDLENPQSRVAKERGVSALLDAW